MTTNGVLQIVLYLVVLLLLVKPLGLYMSRVYEGQPVGLDRALGPIERFLYKISGTNPDEGMDWKVYALAVIVFSLLSGLVVYVLQRVQAFLPLNPQGLSAVAPDLAFNTAVSFMTNTNWQNYGGETTMSYLTQMLALTVQNFVSAAVGMAVLMAVIRGFRAKSIQTLGNFWADLVRGTLYILLPLSIVLALFLVSQGVVQTFNGNATETLLQPATYQVKQTDASGNPVLDANGDPVMDTIALTQTQIAMGPAASQIAIKMLGTNGGGFFNANSAHPLENPNAATNFVEVLSILLISGGLCYTFGKMVGDTRQGWALLIAMTVLLVGFIFIAYSVESTGNPLLTPLGVDQTASDLQPGGNMEGKEARFGIANSALWATATTAASNGSVNSMHDSYTPLGGFVPLAMLSLAEVVFGGVGCGLYGMFIFVIIAVFVAGLMVGRTPEYLGKKVEAYEMKMASLTFLILPLLALDATALAVVLDVGKVSILNPGPHGFSEVLYAFMSQADNNGSAFGGLTGNTVFYNLTGGIVMLFGRFFMMIPPLAIAGSFARKKIVPPSAGTLPTHNSLFIVWLLFVVVIVGALTFFPALALGPIVEHLMLFH
jgi:K+-transporting ATPase ATPase A chain